MAARRLKSVAIEPKRTKTAPTVESTRATKPRSLKDAVNGSERDLLVTIREKVAAEIDAGVPAHALAPLYRQLRDIDKEIRLLDQRAKQEAADGSIENRSFDAASI